jgi:hypothetical protein
VRPEGLGKLKEQFNGHIESRARDIPACSILFKATPLQFKFRNAEIYHRHYAISGTNYLALTLLSEVA